MPIMGVSSCQSVPVQRDRTEERMKKIELTGVPGYRHRDGSPYPIE
jgi:hypothetical protein